MKITILCVGKIKERFFSDAVSEYLKRLKPYAEIKVIEVDDEKTQGGASEIEIAKTKEAQRLEKHMAQNEGAYKIALVIEGKQMPSEDWAELVKKHMVSGISSFVFIIGGSVGLSKSIIEKCDFKLSFSQFTFPHQLMRVILLEQIYRCFKILANEPYHK